MTNALLEPLDWDDDEGPTKQDVRSLKQPRDSSRRGWLLITGDTHRRVTLPCQAPRTERDLAPETLTSGDDEPRNSAESFVHTLSTVIDVTEIAEDADDFEEVDDREQVVDERSHLDSEIRPLIGLGSIPPVSALVLF